MDAETGFMIEGKVYEVPALDSLTMGERRVMFELSAITQEDFVQEVDETADEHDRRLAKMMRHPGFMEALMTVAYQRGNPGLKPEKVRLVIDRTNFVSAVEGFTADEEEPDEVPLASTSEPNESSSSGSLDNENSTEDSSANGGNSSTSGSDEPASLHPIITGSRSGTYSTSDPKTSVA